MSKDSSPQSARCNHGEGGATCPVCEQVIRSSQDEEFEFPSNQHKRLDGDDPRIERIFATHRFVPLGLYDEITKLAEYAIGEIIEEQNSLLEQLETSQRALIRIRDWRDIRHTGQVRDIAAEAVLNPASEPRDDSMMLRHADGTPYMDVRDYHEQRGDPPRLRYGDSNQDTERQ